MTAVVQLRADVAPLMHGDAGLARQTTPDLAHVLEVREDLMKELAHLHMTLKPIHPNTEDQELARYFILNRSEGPLDEAVLGSVRELEAVTAAYIKPEAEPA